MCHRVLFLCPCCRHPVSDAMIHCAYHNLGGCGMAEERLLLAGRRWVATNACPNAGCPLSNAAQWTTDQAIARLVADTRGPLAPANGPMVPAPANAGNPNQGAVVAAGVDVQMDVDTEEIQESAEAGRKPAGNNNNNGEGEDEAAEQQQEQEQPEPQQMGIKKRTPLPCGRLAGPTIAVSRPARRAWTEDEISTLIRGRLSGKPYSALATNIPRHSCDAMMSKWVQLKKQGRVPGHGQDAEAAEAAGTAGEEGTASGAAAASGASPAAEPPKGEDDEGEEDQEMEDAGA